jgi:hypothetical protein
MANWTPNNSEAANSASLGFWVDASDSSNYNLDGGTRTDQDIGTRDTLNVIYNLGTSGSSLGPENLSYPATLTTGTISGKNGFRFGHKPVGSGWVSTNFTSSIYPPVGNASRFMIGVMSRMMINTYPSVAGFKAFFGYGSLGGTSGMSILGDANTDNNSPFVSFGFTNLFPSTEDLIDEDDAALVSFRHDVADNGNLLFLSGTQIASSSTSISTTNGVNDGMQLGSNYANDNSDVTIHELLIYSIADTETTQSGDDANFRETVEGYLAHKWSIASLLPSDHPYKNAAPQIGGGGDTPTFGNDEGEKLNVNPDGAKDGPTINRFGAVNTNYGKTGGIEQIPFTLQQPGSFSIKRRTVAYKVTRGDSNE